MSEALPLLLVLLPLVGAVLLSALPASPARLRGLATLIAIATLALVGYAAWAEFDAAFEAPWFRFQNLQVSFALALPRALIPLLGFACGVGALACASTPLDAEEAPRVQLAAGLAWMGLACASAMAQDLVLLAFTFEVLVVVRALTLVTRRREDAVASSATLLAPSLVGSALLVAFVVYATTRPFPADGELALSSSIRAAHEGFGATTATCKWILVALAASLLPRATLWPAHGAWNQLQHRITPNGALLGLVGGLPIALWIFVELSQSYAPDPEAWGHIALPAVFVAGMLGLGVLANLRESVRRRISALAMVPLTALPIALVSGALEDAALACAGVLAIGAPVSSLVLLGFAFAERFHPGRLRDLRGVARGMPRFFALFVAANVLAFGVVPGTASARVLHEIAAQLEGAHVLLWLAGGAGYVAAQLAALTIVLWSLFGKADERVAARDLSAREFVLVLLPLLAALGLALVGEELLTGTREALEAFFARGGADK